MIIMLHVKCEVCLLCHVTLIVAYAEQAEAQLELTTPCDPVYNNCISHSFFMYERV